ncbi:MAG: transposase [Saprospiraceae bacterium]
MRTQLPLVGEIKRFFPIHRICVVKVFMLLVQCIIRCRTVCLYKCRTEVGSVLSVKDIKINTAYARLIRFFKIKNIDAFCVGIIRLVIYLMDFKGPVYMSLDRTNWKIGSKNINVLFIGLLITDGIFIPVIWQLYNKRGNTSEEERCELVRRFFKVWPVEKEVEITLLGDREFIGVNWFEFMISVGFSFVVRARMQDYYSQIPMMSGKTVDEVERYIQRKINKHGYFQTPINLKGQLLYYTVFSNTSKRQKKNDKWLILISDKKDINWISTSFPKRWGIEVFFYHCKTNGFNLADLNFTDLLKAQLMIGVTAVCYVLSIKKGIECQRTEKTLLKNYGIKRSRAISLFRLGYDNLKNEIHSVLDLIALVRKNLPEMPLWKVGLWKRAMKSV